MKSHHGFTLIETMVALVLSGIVALLAYGTMRAGFETRDRLTEYRHESESVATMRALLTDALRHPADAGELGYPTFRIEREIETPSLNGNRLQFVSRGVSSPLGAGARWLVTLASAGDGMHFSAEPLDETDLGSIASVLPGVRAVRVQVMADVTDAAWRDSWTSERQAPAAVRLDFIGEKGAAGSPLVVRSSLELPR